MSHLGGETCQGLAVSGDGAAGAHPAVAVGLLDNVTTVLLIAPVTLLVCDRLGVSPVRS